MATNNVPPELQQLLAESVNRTKYQNPLFAATSRLAYSMLPTYAQDGQMGAMGQAAPVQPMASGGDSGGMPDILKMLLSGLGGAALNGLGPNGNALGALMDGLKKLFAKRQAPGLTGPHTPGNPNLPYQDQQFNGWQDPTLNDLGLGDLLPSDPGVYYGHGGGAMPSDPSGGTGIGPGMQDYYNSLGGSGGGDRYGYDPNEE